MEIETTVNLIKEGNNIAFTHLYTMLHKDVFNFVYRYLQSSETTEEIVQATFIRLWEVRKSLDSSKNVRNMLLTIAKNYTLNYIQHKQVEYKYFMTESSKEQESSWEDNIDKTNRREVLYKAIEQLSPSKREVCTLKIEKGLSNYEIAQEMGISINTVKVEYSNSVKALKKILKFF